MELKQKQGDRSGLKRLGLVAAGAILFFVGVGFGNGRLSLDLKPESRKVVSGLPDKLDYSELDQVYQSLKDNYDGKLTEAQIVDGLKHGLASAAKDPYTVYFNEKEAKEFTEQLNNSFAGVGARLSKDADDNLIVGEAIAGFPAEKAGLKARDIIIEVNGQPTAELTLEDAISKIRGPEGSKVKIKVVRDRAQTLDFEITRAIISLPSVTTKTLDGNVGYIQVGNFAQDTTELVRKAADEFKAKNVKGIVLDLRNNPGGYLDQAEGVSSVWLKSGSLVLSEKRGGTTVQTLYARGNNTLEGVKTVVLINEGSASASEIVAGALRDNKAAYVIGTKSYGKGVVQEQVCISGSRSAGQACPADVLKVTVASWYRPNGQNINKKGITPDQTVKISDADAKASKDTQLEAAQAYLAK